MTNTVLVTGATGFAGRHSLMALQQVAQQEDLHVVAACREPRRLPAGFNGEVRTGDLHKRDDIDKLLEGVDVVCHCAAWSSLWGNTQRSHDLYLQPSLNLLNASVEKGLQRFVFVSSTSAPGPQAKGDARAPGKRPGFWPHIANVSRIETAMRTAAGGKTTMVNLRLGLFIGEAYGLGLLPILLPRLRTHLVPWLNGGRTGMPLLADKDLGQAMQKAATAPGLSGYEAFNIVGTEVPTVREVITYLHDEFGYPKPHFSVPFPLGYAFAWLMEKLDPLVPWDPLVVRAIIYLLEETYADNTEAKARLGYVPQADWRETIARQVDEIGRRQQQPMKMAVPLAGD